MSSFSAAELHSCLIALSLPRTLSWLTYPPVFQPVTLESSLTSHSHYHNHHHQLWLLSRLNILASVQAFIIFHLHDPAVLPASNLTRLPSVLHVVLAHLSKCTYHCFLSSTPKELTLNSLVCLRVSKASTICFLSAF